MLFFSKEIFTAKLHSSDKNMHFIQFETKPFTHDLEVKKPIKFIFKIQKRILKVRVSFNVML